MLIPINSEFVAMGADSPYALFLAEAQTVSYHRDEFRVRGFAFDVRHRIAEELLQSFDMEAAFSSFLWGAASWACQVACLLDLTRTISRHNLIVL